ncbi:dihydrofolate reductase family protein [Conyzicola sp.]|uniref:dihydrofolate reductase family protein n=1 Tax=Conyzicola sp. TaxID=1969404 RepID=UPI00398A1C41
MPGSIHIDLFTTLDGVSQAPGGPDEDNEGGFAFGGWQAPLIDTIVGSQVIDGIREADALLLGRRTYDIFAGYWPGQLDSDSEIARAFDAIPKYVASRGTPELPWRDSHLLAPDLAAAVTDLRNRHRSIHVVGSIDFARSLVAHGLFDVLNLWVYPIVVGAGKRLFPDDGQPATLELLAPPAPSERGAVLLRYGPAGGAPETGDMTA